MRLRSACALFLASLAIPVAAGAQAPDVADAAAPADDKRPWILRLDAIEEYRFRHATSHTRPAAVSGDPDDTIEDEQDHDLRLLLSGDATHQPLGLRVDLALALWADLDGVAPAGATSTFGSLYDKGSPSIWFDVYALSLTWRSPTDAWLVRAGRQSAEYGRDAVFDGVTARGRWLGRRLEVAVFGGRTVHFFEIGDGLFEDWLASAALVLRPHPTLRLDLDYRFLRETVLSRADRIDHGYGVRARWHPRDWLYVSGAVRGVDDAVTQVDVRASATWADLDLGLDVRVDAQPSRLGEMDDANDPYFLVLGRSLRHLRGMADLWKGFDTRGGRFVVHAGWAGRQLLGETETRFNRNNHRVFLRLDGRDLGVKGPFASIVADWHFEQSGASADREGLLTVGGAAGFDTHRFRAEVGTAWQRYKYRYYQDAEEIESVRTVWVDLRARPLSWLDLRLRYEFERFARDVHTVTFGLGQRY